MEMMMEDEYHLGRRWNMTWCNRCWQGLNLRVVVVSVYVELGADAYTDACCS